MYVKYVYYNINCNKMSKVLEVFVRRKVIGYLLSDVNMFKKINYS